MIRRMLVLLPLLILLSAPAALGQTGVSMGITKMARFLHYLSNNYVDSIDVERQVDYAIIQILNNLDPHSVYISREEVRAANEQLEGNFEGVGVEFIILNDTLMVVNPISGGPSERVGIAAGDRIIRVDQEHVAGVGLQNRDVHRLLRGPKGTKVVVFIQRKGVEGLLEFEITRDRIPIHSLDAAYMLDHRVGYIKLNRFSLTTEEEFLQALNQLKRERMRDLILDLSGNGGGFLNAAVSLADHFLSPRRLIVYTEGRGSPRTEFFSTGAGQFDRGNLVIIIDEGSASASEIVAGAVQDWDRGIILGRRSFGKGLVQSQLPLPDGSMIRLTVARYHTPSGRVIQRPYTIGDADAYHREIGNRIRRGELGATDGLPPTDSLRYQTLVSARAVFGGGGITPDILVPLDTAHFTAYFSRLIRRGILNQFAVSYVDQHRDALSHQYPTFGRYSADFRVGPELESQLLAFAEGRGLATDHQELAISRPEIHRQLKALVAQNLFTSSHYFQIINQHNPKVLRAHQVLRSWNQYQRKLGK